MTEQSPYRSQPYVEDQIDRILGFYTPEQSINSFTAERDERTGQVTHPTRSHLVAASRFVINCARATEIRDRTTWEPLTADALRMLHTTHYDADANGYDWIVTEDERDRRRSPYGHAFVVSAIAHAHTAGVSGAADQLTNAIDIFETGFFEPAQHLFRSECDATWSPIEAYRGQNANMHACEAYLAAYDATDDPSYLSRAVAIAKRLTLELATETDGRIWEHYTEEWEHDFSYNQSNPRDQFRPWGYQPGHHLEWAKLLAQIDSYCSETDAVAAPWAIDRGTALFAWATTYGWDDSDGGFYYTVNHDNQAIVTDTYGWTVAEAIGAAAWLHRQTGAPHYAVWYDRFWTYADTYLRAPHGNWYERVSRSNAWVEPTDGPAVEPGYHPIGACADGLHMVVE